MIGVWITDLHRSFDLAENISIVVDCTYFDASACTGVGGEYAVVSATWCAAPTSSRVSRDSLWMC